MTEEQILDLKRGDFVLVKYKNKWVNALILNTQLQFDIPVPGISDKYDITVLHMGDSNAYFGATAVVSEEDIKLPTDAETLKKVLNSIKNQLSKIK